MIERRLYTILKRSIFPNKGSLKHQLPTQVDLGGGGYHIYLYIIYVYNTYIYILYLDLDPLGGREKSSPVHCGDFFLPQGKKKTHRKSEPWSLTTSGLNAQQLHILLQ